MDLGLDTKDHDVVDLYAKLYETLLSEARADKRFILVVDEAQNLDPPVLEMIRLLSDFETQSHKLIQIVMVGQPQLETKLAREDLQQLRQRISIVSRIKPLNRSEVSEYIKHRCKVAGYHGSSPFTAEAVSLIALASNGIPRVINNICFNALTLGFAENKKKINPSIIEQVISDLHMEISPISEADLGNEIEGHHSVPIGSLEGRPGHLISLGRIKNLIASWRLLCRRFQ